ncbi:hypothetical protein BT69DRAFT_1193007, partial [Atractiella rhizophila]
LPNTGREGGTYLRHILRNYECTTALAPLTLFMQPHLAWAQLSTPKIELITDSTGFLTTTVVFPSNCGKDLFHGVGNGEYERMKDIYRMFKGKECIDGTHQVATYSGQFVVSRERIERNLLSTYQELDDMLEAPEGSDIYKEGWWNNGPENPFFGHSVERSWPTMFECEDPRMVESCPESDWLAKKRECQCFDS